MTSDPLSRLFAAERAVQPPAHAVEQGVSRLLTDLAGQVAPLPVATGSLKLGVSLVSKWLAVGFVVGVGGAGAATQMWAPTAAASPQPSSAILAPAAPLEVASTRVVEAPAAAAEAPAEAPPSVVAHGERPAPAASAPPADSATTFDAELRLITAAKSELDKGRPQLAAAWLSEHAERFPGGVFAVERDAMRILVRCNQTKAPSAAHAFAEQHPTSPMVERLLRACTPSEPSTVPSSVDFPK